MMTRIAKIGGGISAAITGWASLAHINEILQCIAFLVAIVAGFPAAKAVVKSWLRKGNKNGN